jgi:hypothetical protein
MWMAEFIWVDLVKRTGVNLRNSEKPFILGIIGGQVRIITSRALTGHRT